MESNKRTAESGAGRVWLNQHHPLLRNDLDAAADFTVTWRLLQELPRHRPPVPPSLPKRKPAD